MHLNESENFWSGTGSSLSSGTFDSRKYWKESTRKRRLTTSWCSTHATRNSLTPSFATQKWR